MRLPVFDSVLWAAGPVCNAALICVLLMRRRLHVFSALGLWSAVSLLTTFALFLIYRVNAGHPYAVAYWTSEFIDAVLQLAVVLQVARIVLAPLRSQPRLRSIGMSLLPVAAGVLALTLTWAVHPQALTQAGVLEIRGQLFTSILIGVVFTAVLLLSQQMGLHWSSHVMAVGYGLTAWALVSLTLDLLHGYWGRYHHFLVLEHVRMFAYLGVFLYWSVALWRDEPERKLATPEMHETLLRLTDRVSYDLAKALGPRGKEFR